MLEREYLVSHGCTGDFGRFRLVQSLDCGRGARVVVRSQRGLELGVVLCRATARHAQLLGSTYVGELLREASAADEQEAEQLRGRGQRLFEEGRRLVGEAGLPLELLDVDVLLDGRQATLYYLRWGDCDFQPLLQSLALRHELTVDLQDLTPPAEDHHAEGGCGKPGCGQVGGGCQSCSSGGCATGCGSASQAGEVRDYFAQLRQQMEQRQRTPLL